MPQNHIAIEYCTSWGYYPRAAGLAAEIQKKFGIAPQLIRGRGGVFEITMGNDLLFSKKKLGRFPQAGEVEKEIEQRVTA